MSLRAWPDDFPDDIARQRRVPYESRADSVMYLEVLAELAPERNWVVRLFDAKNVEAEATRLLGDRAHDILRPPRGPGSALGKGPPDGLGRHHRRRLSGRRGGPAPAAGPDPRTGPSVDPAARSEIGSGWGAATALEDPRQHLRSLRRRRARRRGVTSRRRPGHPCFAQRGSPGRVREADSRVGEGSRTCQPWAPLRRRRGAGSGPSAPLAESPILIDLS